MCESEVRRDRCSGLSFSNVIFEQVFAYQVTDLKVHVHVLGHFQDKSSKTLADYRIFDLRSFQDVMSLLIFNLKVLNYLKLLIPIFGPSTTPVAAVGVQVPASSMPPPLNADINNNNFTSTIPHSASGSSRVDTHQRKPKQALNKVNSLLPRIIWYNYHVNCRS